MDILLHSRLQFALTIGFHYIYPPLSIGLGLALVIMEGLFLKTGDPLYQQMTRFWTRIFGLIFALGVGTGIVMEFEFGTNWARYSRFVGDIFGSPLAAEGIFAFFLESGFLAILLFGWDRVGKGMHFLATVMVALGSHLSAIWIIVANSWMQTPAAFHVVDTPVGPRAEITDFWGAVFNPSMLDRLLHTLMGAWQAGAFFLVSVSAWYLLKNRHHAFAKRSMAIGFALALVASLGQLATGHAGAVTAARHQPVKLAAFEGLYETRADAGLTIFGWVDEAEQRVSGPEIPGLLSLMVGGSRATVVKGLNEVPVADRPPVQAVFQLYHAMVGLGMLLILMAWAGAILAWRGTLFRSPLLLKLGVFSVLVPQAANQLGWAAAEIGRQPWIVQGLMRTRDALSEVLVPGEVLTSLLLFSLIYLGLFIVFILLLDQKVRKGPLAEDLKTNGGAA